MSSKPNALKSSFNNQANYILSYILQLSLYINIFSKLVLQCSLCEICFFPRKLDTVLPYSSFI